MEKEEEELEWRRQFSLLLRHGDAVDRFLSTVVLREDGRDGVLDALCAHHQAPLASRLPRADDTVADVLELVRAYHRYLGGVDDFIAHDPPSELWRAADEEMRAALRTLLADFQRYVEWSTRRSL